MFEAACKQPANSLFVSEAAAEPPLVLVLVLVPEPHLFKLSAQVISGSVQRL